MMRPASLFFEEVVELLLLIADGGDPFRPSALGADFLKKRTFALKRTRSRKAGVACFVILTGKAAIVAKNYPDRVASLPTLRGQQ